MTGMAWIWAIFSVFAIVVVLRGFVPKSRKKKLPPGPKGLPILGHFHLLGKNPHQDLYQLAKKHGPIMYLRFGYVPAVVVSSPQAAELFLKTYDLNFASRPYHEASWYLSYEQSNLTFGPYGTYWRNMRKLVTLQLLSNHKVSSFEPMRREQLGVLIDSLKKEANVGGVVDLSSRVTSLSADMTCLMVFGRKYSDKGTDNTGFRDLAQEAMTVAGTPNLGDYFPFISALDLQGLIRRMKNLNKVFDEFLEKIIDDHVQCKEEKETKDFVDTMLAIMASGEAEFRLDRRHVKAVLLDMLLAGADTSATIIEWVMSELLRHPNVMKKVQKELEEVVGLDRMVEESDLNRLEYLGMVIKESFRLHPVSPFLLPHESMEDCEVDGYEIVKGSRVIVNVWAIGQDHNVWPDPDKFLPERFVGSEIDVRGHHFQLLPFGSGRRGCPGLQLGLTVVHLVVAQLCHCFDWELPNGMSPKDLDMEEHFGGLTTRAKHLMALPTYRLH